uniref:Nudix (nucleoside diphosphate linked moiety X)-type motif 22 n=1 Tax=Oreochromis niloticus TaxID=8128 RepID=A0A669B384_ORENI
MDPEVSVLLHCAHWQGLLRSQVQVELSERHTDLALERHIDEVWMKRVSKEPWLFNRAKFRLHSFCLIKRTPKIICVLDYLGTNWSCGVAKLRQRGEAEFGDPLTLLAQPLGVGGILCTSNGQVVMIRSQKVAEAGGLLDISGGHPEREYSSELPGTAQPDGRRSESHQRWRTECRVLRQVVAASVLIHIVKPAARIS